VAWLAAGAALASAVPVALASRRPPISPEGAAEALVAAAGADRPTFTIIVPARDEAPVLPRLVRDIAAQDYRREDGSPMFELVVVDDRSSDGSGGAATDAARRAGIDSVTRVVARRGADLPDGKGAALTAVQPDTCNGDVVLVLDADAQLDPGFLRRAAGYFAAGLQAVTARRRVLDRGVGWLEGAQADEQTLDGELNRGRWALGGCSEFRGNGFMIRRDLLRAVGGWRADALTEDLDLSSRIAAAAGVRVAWAIDVEVAEEPVRTLAGLWQQRCRWAEGAVRRTFEHGPAIVRSPELPLSARLDFVAYAGQLTAPSIGLGVLAGAIATGRRGPLAVMASGYLATAMLLGWDALRWESSAGVAPPRPLERLARTVRVALFGGIWLAAVPRALAGLASRRGPIRYQKMAHRGAGDGLGISGA